MIMRRRWTAEDERELSALYWEGYEDDDIADVLGRTRSSIKMRRYELGLKRKPGPKENLTRYVIYKDDHYYAHGTIKEIAEKTGVDIRTVYRWLKGLHGYEAMIDD